MSERKRLIRVPSRAPAAAAGATEPPVPSGMLHTWFWDQLERRGAEAAVIDESLTLTYRDLDLRAARIARWLIDNGAQPNQLVAIVMEKGWEQVVAALAVMYSGAAYLPIDPAFPPQRINYLLGNGEVRLALTQSSLQNRVQWPQGVAHLEVDREPPADSSISRTAVQTPSDLAYVIYTSGSTGTPKGVAIEHRSALNTIVDINRRFAVLPDDRIFALSSLSFDLSVYDIFGTLAAGAAIVLPRGNAARDPSKWVPLMAQSGVSIWNSAPALMEMLVEYIADRPGMLPPGLRLVMLSGDWIPLSLPDRIRDLAAGARVVSLGGATEASIWSIAYSIDRVDPQWKSIPYGKPLASQRVMVLDGALEPRPTWVPGDLYIGGEGLARGYWRDEEKTAAAFIIHPSTGDRLYRTGDLGRYLPDGNIEFLGRNDTQVKIRGHRIELEEIEAVLERHPGIRMAAVQAIGDSSSNRRLVAYVAPEHVHVDELAAGDQADLWDALVSAGRGIESDPAALEQRARQEAAQSDLDRLTPYYAMTALGRLGMFRAVGERYSADEVLRKGNIQSGYSWLIRRWLNHLAADGFLRTEDGTSFVSIRLPDENDVAAGWQRLHKSGLFDSATWDQLRGWCEQIADVLTGLRSPLELLFPGGSSSLATQVYQQNRYVHAVSAAILGRLRCPRTLRILEIGAGTGGTTVFLLPVLPAGKTHYVFTDVSQFFLNHARKQFAANDFISYGILNIENPPAPQGFAEQSFDAIFGGNVMHDAKDVGVALANAKAMLAAGAIVMLEEATRWRRFFDITVGLIEGIGRVADDRAGADAPFFSVDQWEAAFRKAGFVRFAAFPSAADAGTHVLLAATGPVHPRGDTRVPLDSDLLRSFSRDHLPDYMVPSAFVILDDFPLSANGKVDRKALPLPDVSSRAASQTFIAPVTPAQRTIAATWSEVLGAAEVGINDNFFELGGDSLLAVRVLSRVRQELGVEIDLARFLEIPTVANLAAFAEAGAKPAASSPAV